MQLTLKIILREIIARICFDHSPLVIIPLVTYISAISVHWTVIIFICTLLALVIARRKLQYLRPKSAFFLTWLITTVVWLVFVYNYYVVMLLEILPEENLILVLSMVLCLYFLYQTKIREVKTVLPFTKTSVINDNNVEEDELLEGSPSQSQQMNKNGKQIFCLNCQAYVPQKNHCFWMDCCIVPENESIFFWANIFGIFACIYGANLSLTTVCTPRVLQYPYFKLMLPDDCSEVYSFFSSSIPFVSSLHCIFLSLCQLWYVVKKIGTKMGFPGCSVIIHQMRRIM